MYNSKILLAVAVIIILILVYFYFRNNGKPSKEKIGNKKDKYSLDNIGVEKEGDLDIEDLYNKFHEDFARGISLEDFQKEYDDEDGIIYLKLVQLYKLGKENPKINLLRDITPDDYAKVLGD